MATEVEADRYGFTLVGLTAAEYKAREVSKCGRALNRHHIHFSKLPAAC